MSKTPTFDPQTQMAAAIDELDQQIIAATQVIARLRWLRDRVAEDIAELAKRADELVVMDETAAADALGIKPDHLRRMRRKLGLPHVNFGGNVVRYTKQNLVDICSMLSIGTAAVRKPRHSLESLES